MPEEDAITLTGENLHDAVDLSINGMDI